MEEYIQELENKFDKYKIEEQKTYTIWGIATIIGYNYRLYNKNGECEHNFEFNTPKTVAQLKKEYVKSMTGDLPF